MATLNSLKFWPSNRTTPKSLIVQIKPKLSITNGASTAISGASTTSYVYGGKLERKINPTGTYEFPMGSATLAQTAIVSANNLVGTDRLATTYVNGALTGTTPNTTYSGVAITSTLNAGWFSVNPNQQPTAGSYDMTLKIQGSTNTLPAVGSYTLIKRDNSTSPWAASGNYNLGTNVGGIVTVKNSNLTSFSDFAIGRGASDISLGSNGFEKSKLAIYPNPTTNFVTISAQENISKIELFDIAGKQIWSQNVNNVETNLDLSNANSGIYFVRILMENGSTQNQKIIKN